MSLSDQEYSLLAVASEFSGGQMENIARKYPIGTILNGERVLSCTEGNGAPGAAAS